MKKILVTGDAGFIATHLKKALNKLGHDVYGFEINNNPNYYADIHYDIVFHLAAVARTMDCTEDPFGQPFISNVQLTKTLLERFSFDKFVYSSSCSLYGDCYDRVNSITENSPVLIPNIYSAQKYFSERLIDLNCKHRGIPSFCYRFFNVYGPGQSKLGAYPNVLASMIRTFKEKGVVEVTGDGTQTRDFISVHDIVKALLTSFDLTGNRLFNVCTDTETDINYLAKFITPKISYIPERPFDIKYQRGSYMSLHTTTGWLPEVSLGEGVMEVLKDENLL